MPAPLAKGVIIAASVLLAAGIAIYESPQFRAWAEQTRRKIAIAINNIGDEINQHAFRSPRERAEERRRRRREIIQRNQAELVRRARDEGVAVDLDELNSVGVAAEVECAELEAREAQEAADRELAERLQAEWNLDEGSSSGSRNGSGFDDLVDKDGKLRESSSEIAVTTASEIGGQGQVRRRGQRDSSAFEKGAIFANPFADDAAQVIFDRELMGAEEDEGQADRPAAHDSRPSTAIPDSNHLTDNMNLTGTLIDLTEPHNPTILSNSDLYESAPVHAQSASIHSLPSPTAAASLAETETETETDADAEQTQSFYSFTTSARAEEDAAAAANATRPHSRLTFTDVSDGETDSDLGGRSTGTLTPTEDGFSTFSSSSQVGDDADNNNAGDDADDGHDARSETFTESGFSEFEDARADGILTPTSSSWTDVGSDSGSDAGRLIH